MKNREYFEGKLNEYLGKWNPYSHLNGYTFSDNQYKRQLKNDLSNWNSLYCRINCNKDVEALFNGFISNINIFESAKRLLFDDGYIMYKQLYYYTEGLRKASRNMDNPNCKFNYTKKDMDKLFLELEEMSEKMENLNMRRAYQD